MINIPTFLEAREEARSRFKTFWPQTYPPLETDHELEDVILNIVATMIVENFVKWENTPRND